jgi:hypothetical protein
LGHILEWSISFEISGEIYVSATLPSVVMDVVGNSDLDLISKEIEEKLKRVVDTI